ncbi:MAG: spermidine/putrescine ABC transporter substrate-binding protein [Rickettsiella sp.]|nr:spermidine/putrescine ABC transporter substrate-binding protein [Rickettsiella sp.]
MRFILYFLCLFSLPVFAQENVVNVYNWSNYISNDVLKEFTKETGIKVNYTTYDSNETMYAKLKANPNSGYDIVVPSTYYVDRMIKQGMLQALDKTRLTNFKNLNPGLLNKPFDPDNHYSIPYFWSTTGIAVNTNYHVLSKLQNWSDLWSPEYRNQLLMLDDVREVFSIALLVLHYSPNDSNPEHIKQAYIKLKQLMPNIRLFNADGIKSLYIDEDLTLGMGWNGDIYQVTKENPAVQFVYPKEGFITAIDSMAIPTGATHLDNAYRFINFVLRPDIAEKISLETGYASPNQAAVKLMPKSILDNPTIYPSKEIFKRSIVQTDVGTAEAIYLKYWDLLKARNTGSF